MACPHSQSPACLPPAVVPAANEKDYSHEGFGFTFKKVQADTVMKLMSSPEVQHFKADEKYSEEKPVKTYGR